MPAPSPPFARTAGAAFSDDAELPMTDELLRRLRESGW